MNPFCLVSTFQASSSDAMVWELFSWHILGLLVTKNNSFKCCILPRYCNWSYASIYKCTHPLVITSSRTMHCVTILKLQQIFYAKLSFTVPRSQSHWTHLGCGEMGDSNPGCAANQSKRITGCHDNIMEPKFQKSASRISSNSWQGELSWF